MALMETINDLKGQRRARVDEARSLLDAAEEAGRDLTAEEAEQYDRITGDVDTLGSRIERLESQWERENRFSASGDNPVTRPEPTEQRDQNVRPTGTDEYRAAWWTYIRRSLNELLPQEHRAMSVGTDADGGYTVPDEFQRQLIEGLREQNIMRQIASTITTGSGTMTVPVVVDRGAAAWTAEAGTFNDSDDEFAVKTLGAHKLTRITKVSEELLNDSAFNIAGHLSDSFGYAFGVAEETAMVNGDGSGKPRGVLLDATAGKTAAATAAVTADEILDLYHSLKRVYRSRARFLMRDATALAIRKLKDTTNQYLWQPGLQAGQPDTLLGRPVTTSGDVPAMAASAKSIAFGDFSYYWIADRQQIAMQRLNELYSATGQVGFRMFTRLDGRLMLPEAVVVLTQAAS